MNKYLICILIVVLCVLPIYGQNYILSTNTLETDNQIEPNVKNFFKDSDGFMWMASSSGIARFDGHSFIQFNTTNSQLRSLLTLNGKELVEDEEGYIWVVGDKTADLIHHRTFEIIPFEEKFPDVPFDGHIGDLKQNNKGEIFFKLTDAVKFYKYKVETGFEKLDFIPQEGRFSIYPKVETAWMIENVDTGTCKKYHLETGKVLKSFQREWMSRFDYIENCTKKDLFWATRNDTLTIFEVQKDRLKPVFVYKNNKEIKRAIVSLYYLSQQDKFIIRLNGNEFFVLDLATKKITAVAVPQIFEQELFGRGSVDNQDILWTSNRKNIHLLRLNTNIFQQYPPFSPARGIWVNQNTLFGADANAKTDLKTGKVLKEIPPEKGYIAVANSIKNELWVGGVSGISKVNPNTLEILEQFPVTAAERIVFWSILRNENENWWAGTMGKGLFYKGKNEAAFYPFKQYNNFEKALSSIHFLEEKGNIWAASKNGLYLIHPQKGAIARYAQNAKKGFQIPFSNIYFTHKKGDEYWVASSNSGIIRFTLNEKYEITHLKHFTIENGLPSNTVYAILEDDKGRLWMSTFKGLVCLDTETENIQVFNKSDGLTEMEFNRTSYAKGDDGRIYFGSLNGVTAFYPDEIVRQSDLEKPIVISQFSIYNKNENHWKDFTQQLNKRKKVVLEPSDRFFKLSVSLLDFFDANALRYHYKIDGLLNDFQLIKGNQLEVSGLPYGKYQLRIKGQAADGRFSNQELVLPLIVKRPFYLKWWFFLLMFALMIFGFYRIYIWRTKQLSERQQELELLVQERTTKIAAQAEQLKELDQVKSKFFANISHELRTPLTLILGPIKNLINSKNLTNREHTSVLLMQQNSQKLLKRINELLDLSRLDANKMEVNASPTYLYPFLKNIITSIDSTANAKGIQLQFKYHLSENLQLLLDTDKVEKILYNYLSNALKFTPKNGTITIVAKRENEDLQVSVADTGIGIPTEDLVKVFDRFYQSDNNKEKGINTNGTGIGLALCQELAKVLDGNVWAESEIGQGSTFFMQIPLTETFAVKAIEPIIEPANEIPIITEKQTFSKEKPLVLVVEDNADLRQYMQLILQDAYNIQLAENGKVALDWLNNEENALPQLIVSDIMMPIMDGIEFSTIVKSKDEFRHIPMIILTARQSMEVKINALRIGIDDYLTKPFDNVELQTRVHNLIENSKNRTIQDKSKNEETSKLSSADLKWLKNVEQVILDNMSQNDFVLQDVAPKLNMSYSGFRQKIKKITGLSPKQYERTVKLNKARELFKNGEVETVSEVMYLLGFGNHYYFSKIYKEEFGIMPSEELK